MRPSVSPRRTGGRPNLHLFGKRRLVSSVIVVNCLRRPTCSGKSARRHPASRFVPLFAASRAPYYRPRPAPRARSTHRRGGRRGRTGTAHEQERKDNVTFCSRRTRPAATCRQTCSTPRSASGSSTWSRRPARGLLQAALLRRTGRAAGAESIVHADWLRLLGAASCTTCSSIASTSAATHSIRRSPRGDSKGKVIDFVRLSETRATWASLLPEPPDPRSPSTYSTRPPAERSSHGPSG